MDWAVLVFDFYMLAMLVVAFIVSTHSTKRKVRSEREAEASSKISGFRFWESSRNV